MSRAAQLERLLPPPVSPHEPPSADDWRRCEAAFGGLPPDYHYFMDRYGGGAIQDFLWFLNPGAEEPGAELQAGAFANLGALRTSLQKFPERRGVVNPDAMVPFGATANGDTVYWVTHGEPETWTVAVMGPRSLEVFSYDGGMLDFLVDLLEGNVNCWVFPEGFPGDPPFEFRA